MNIFQRIAWKALKKFIPRSRFYSFPALLGGTTFDYESKARPRSNSIAVACVNWISRTFPEAPLQIMDLEEKAPVIGHELEKLLRRPNDAYSGNLLWMATLADWNFDGNAYWLKVRSGAGKPVQLWWVPQSLIEPKWPVDGSEFISHYEYRPQWEPIELDPEDVVHLRYGMDPSNLRKGLSPLKALVREIYTDDVAADWTAAILRNLAVPGLVISPKDKNATLTPDAKDYIRDQVKARAGGDERGGTLILDGAVSADIISYSPRELALPELRDIPEERVSATLGIPAAVVGLGTGLQQTKVGATMGEMRELAYENNIIPTQRLMAGELNAQLLPEFADPDEFAVSFDISKVRVLQDDQNDLWERGREAWDAGLITRNQFLSMTGQEIVADGDVYKVGLADMFVPASGEGKATSKSRSNGRYEGKQDPPDDDDRQSLEQSMERALTKFFDGQLGRVLDEVR